MLNQKTCTIPEYFHGKNVFLTGGTGFLGKVLIEKLLRSCPGIGDIYVLARPKRGKTLEQRREDIIDAQLFDIIRKEHPEVLNKVKCIPGDVTETKLGINEEDEKLLISKVNIIYHAAASVRFDDPLRKAIITNVRSIREIIQLALRCTDLEMFMHVSTAYCNVDRNFIEERLYPTPAALRAVASPRIRSPLVQECSAALQRLAQSKNVSLIWIPAHSGVPCYEKADCLAWMGARGTSIDPEPLLGISRYQVDWRDVIDLAESDMDLSTFTVKYLAPWPNTYTFTKQIAEHVTEDLCRNKIPSIIFRPSIIVHSDKEPMPGWIDNMNGPFALTMAGLIGISTTFCANLSSFLDYVSVDNVVKGMLIASWDKALSQDKSEVPIYNACSELLWDIKLFQDFKSDISEVVFFEKTIWDFNIQFVQSWYIYYLDVLFHVAMSTIIDLLLKLQRMKPRMVKLVRMIFIAQQASTFFMTNTFVFNTMHFDQLDSKLVESDRLAFMQSDRPKKREDYFKCAVIGLKGLKHFKLKEREMSPEETKERYRRFRFMKYAFKYTSWVIIIYLVFVIWIL